LELEKQRYRNMMKQAGDMVYPIGLLVIACIGLYLFDVYMIPQAVSIASSFGADASFYLALETVLSTFFRYLPWALGFILLPVICIILRPSWMFAVYCLFYRRHCFGLWVRRVTQVFAGIYLIGLRQGLSTRQILSMLENNDHCIVKRIAEKINEESMQGESYGQVMQKAELDPVFLKALRLSYYGQDGIRMTEAYVTNNEIRMNRTMHRFVTAVQIVSYLCIGIIIVLIYRVLLIPMTLLQYI